MEQQRYRLVEENNTIYEIDLNCLEKKEKQKQQEEKIKRQEKAAQSGRSQDFS